jgi:hypothetical protein
MPGATLEEHSRGYAQIRAVNPAAPATRPPPGSEDRPVPRRAQRTDRWPGSKGRPVPGGTFGRDPDPGSEVQPVVRMAHRDPRHRPPRGDRPAGRCPVPAIGEPEELRGRWRRHIRNGDRIVVPIDPYNLTRRSTSRPGTRAVRESGPGRAGSVASAVGGCSNIRIRCLGRRPRAWPAVSSPVPRVP